MAEVTPTPDANDVANNKVLAILAYFGILFLIPLLAAKDSPFARFHANQGLNLFILWIAAYIVVTILVIIVHALALILNLLFLVVLILAILGIINAAKGEMKELPLIGKFKFIK
ncbi:MAG: DUF4870 domain-containing protein [Candidatus Symbiothrix sp.]|jgi:uncharacterized membrane protein|nr:DUF4870 domain-containing protein [Candidatus Symbiothrix sp.]